MSKRIFANKQQSLPQSELSRAPTCYYHKLPIIQFCVKKKCTLPLCQQCLPIHKKEHINNKEIAMEGIVEFQSARSDALNAFDDRRREILAIQIKFKHRITEYRNSILTAVDSILDKFSEDCLVADGNLEILNEIDERSQEIRKGSLKELIRYYEDIYGAEHFRKLYKMYTGDYLATFQMQISQERLGIVSQIVKEGIRNLALPHNQTPIVLPESQNTPKKAQISPVDTNKVHNHHKNHMENKKSMEEDDESEISSYQPIISKKPFNEPNIYTQQNSKLTDPQSSHPSQHSSQVSRSKSKKKKGLSLTKSHAQLPINTLPSFRDTQMIQPQPVPKKVEALQVQRNQHRQNWRKFVNMGQNPQNENRPVYEPSVLNPRQMREMIVKKKNQSKERHEKELRTNKSVEFFPHPTSEKLGRV